MEITLPKKLIKIILLLGFLTGLCFSQNIAGSYIQVLFLPQGFVLESLGGYGFSNNTEISISTLSSGNPASLSDLNKLSIGMSLQKDTEIKEAWIINIGHKRFQNKLPQSFGVILPLGNFRCGYSFSQKFNSALLYEPMDITAVAYPNGTGEYFQIKDRSFVTAQSLLYSYTMNLGDHYFSFGAKYSLNKLYVYKEIYHARYNHYDRIFNWTSGFRYEKLNHLKLGLFFEDGLQFSKMSTLVVDSTSRPNEYYHPSQFVVVGNLPSKINFGFSYSLWKLLFVGNARYVFWNNISDNYNDQTEFSLSVICHINTFAKISGGFHTTNRTYNNRSIFINTDDLSAVYITGGLVINWKRYELEFSIADSHLFSDDWRKQTIGKLGIGLEF